MRGGSGRTGHPSPSRDAAADARHTNLHLACIREQKATPLDTPRPGRLLLRWHLSRDRHCTRASAAVRQRATRFAQQGGPRGAYVGRAL